MNILFKNGSIVFDSGNMVFADPLLICDCCETIVIPPLCSCQAGTGSFPAEILVIIDGFENAAVGPTCMFCDAVDGTYVLDAGDAVEETGCCFVSSEVFTGFPPSTDVYPCGDGSILGTLVANLLYCITDMGDGTYTHAMTVRVGTRVAFNFFVWGTWIREVVSTESKVLCNQIEGTYDLVPGAVANTSDCVPPDTIEVTT